MAAGLLAVAVVPGACIAVIAIGRILAGLGTGLATTPNQRNHAQRADAYKS
jgi:hypothetical protein